MIMMIGNTKNDNTDHTMLDVTYDTINDNVVDAIIRALKIIALSFYPKKKKETVIEIEISTGADRENSNPQQGTVCAPDPTISSQKWDLLHTEKRIFFHLIKAVVDKPYSEHTYWTCLCYVLIFIKRSN
jgi:hypothetical protein